MYTIDICRSETLCRLNIDNVCTILIILVFGANLPQYLSVIETDNYISRRDVVVVRKVVGAMRSWGKSGQAWYWTGTIKCDCVWGSVQKRKKKKINIRFEWRVERTNFQSWEAKKKKKKKKNKKTTIWLQNIPMYFLVNWTIVFFMPSLSFFTNFSKNNWRGCFSSLLSTPRFVRPYLGIEQDKYSFGNYFVINIKDWEMYCCFQGFHTFLSIYGQEKKTKQNKTKTEFTQSKK